MRPDGDTRVWILRSHALREREVNSQKAHFALAIWSQTPKPKCLLKNMFPPTVPQHPPNLGVPWARSIRSAMAFCTGIATALTADFK